MLLMLHRFPEGTHLSGLNGQPGVSEPKNGTVEVYNLAINDLPGQLEMPNSKMVISYNEEGILYMSMWGYRVPDHPHKEAQL